MGEIIIPLLVIIITACLMRIIYCEYRWAIIPNLALVIMALAGTELARLNGIFSLTESCCGATLLGGPALLSAMIFGTIGGGDVKLLFVLGWLAGPINGSLIFGLGIITAVIFYIVKYVLFRKKETTLAMGIHWAGVWLSGILISVLG